MLTILRDHLNRVPLQYISSVIGRIDTYPSLNRRWKEQVEKQVVDELLVISKKIAYEAC
jgi:hypothetical protein